MIYQGSHWVGRAHREVACLSSPASYRLNIEGVGHFAVAADGKVSQISEEPNVEPGIVAETMLGPVLMLALALRSTYCLHAGAVTVGGRTIAFVGESGRGKSTLAAFLGAEGGRVWQRAADDVLPVLLEGAELMARPHFPQLKLKPEEQPALGLPEQIPLAAVYVLGELADERSGVSPEIRPLSCSQAALALIRHTIAARLFDKQLLARHTDFCAAAASRIPVRRLVYPRRYDVLPQVRELLAADLDKIADGAAGAS